MAQCMRCKLHYRELPDEEGDHDCPHCGLTPESRAGWTYTPGRGWEPEFEPAGPDVGDGDNMPDY